MLHVQPPKIKKFQDSKIFWSLVELTYGEINEILSQEKVERLKNIYLDRMQLNAEWSPIWFGALKRLQGRNFHLKTGLMADDEVFDYWDNLLKAQL